jgi:hypothetical protein
MGIRGTGRTCKKLVKTKRFGDLPCICDEGHDGSHSADLTGLHLKRGAVVLEQGPKIGRCSAWWVKLEDADEPVLRRSQVILNPRSGKVNTAEWLTAYSHYRCSFSIPCYKGMIFYPEWDTAVGQPSAATVFADNAMKWLQKHMPKPKEGKWQLHVGRNSEGVKEFSPSFISWEPMEDVHIRNKKRELKDYSLDELLSEVAERQKQTNLKKAA